jgi:hypothetical protein
MLFNLLFLFIFFIPFVLKALLYISLSHVEATLFAHAEHANAQIPAAGADFAKLATTELCERFRCTQVTPELVSSITIKSAEPIETDGG